MALPQTYGVGHIFGVYSTLAFVTLQSDDIARKLNIDVTVTDEAGRILKEGATLPIVGEQIAYDGITYIIKSVDDNGTNSTFRKISVKGVKYQEI